MHEPPLPRRQPPSLGTSHATPVRNTPADGSSENECKFGALAPEEGRAPPTKKRPTATNRLHQFSALFGWDLALSLHLMIAPCLPMCKTMVTNAASNNDTLASTPLAWWSKCSWALAVMWFPGWAPGYTCSRIHPVRFSRLRTPTSQNTTQRRPTRHHGFGHCHVVVVETHCVFDSRSDVRTNQSTTGHVGESPAASHKRGIIQSGPPLVLQCPWQKVRQLAQHQSSSPQCGIKCWTARTVGWSNPALVIMHLNSGLVPHQPQTSTLRNDMIFSTTDWLFRCNCLCHNSLCVISNCKTCAPSCSFQEQRFHTSGPALLLHRQELREWRGLSHSSHCSRLQDLPPDRPTTCPCNLGIPLPHLRDVSWGQRLFRRSDAPEAPSSDVESWPRRAATRGPGWDASSTRTPGKPNFVTILSMNSRAPEYTSTISWTSWRLLNRRRDVELPSIGFFASTTHTLR